jgi:hypothetical protein
MQALVARLGHTVDEPWDVPTHKAHLMCGVKVLRLLQLGSALIANFIGSVVITASRRELSN